MNNTEIISSIYSVFSKNGFPTSCKDSIDLIESSFDVLTLELMCKSLGVSIIYGNEIKNIDVLEQMNSISYSTPVEMIVTFDKFTIKYAVSEKLSDIGFDCHGVIINERIFGWKKRIIAESLMIGCAIWLRSFGGDTFHKIATTFNRSVVEITKESIVSNLGLKAHRMDVFIDSMIVLGIINGAVTMDASDSMLISDKTRKPASIKRRENHGVLNNYFSKIEFDGTMDSDEISEIEECYGNLVASKAIHIFGADSAIILRFRRFPDDSKRKIYTAGLNNIVVDSRNPGGFIHEYGHALDFYFGILSKKNDFQKIANYYKKEVKRNVGTNRKYNLNYYFRDTEIFSRCFEIYISKTYGGCILLNEPSDENIYPMSEDFLSEVMNYFNKLDDLLFNHYF